MDTFWQTISEYNSETWNFQITLTIVGAILAALLYAAPEKAACRVAVKIYTALLCFWIAGVYYLIYCNTRSYNESMAVFWAIMGLAWLYDIRAGRDETPKASKNPAAAALLCAPAIYPALSLALGRSFPEIVSPIMPCSVAVFSIGLIFAFGNTINLILAMLVLHWSIIAIPKVSLYGITEDYFLSLCIIPALYIFFKNYIEKVAKQPTKPSAKTLDRSLKILCATLGIFFTYMIFKQFGIL